MDENEKEVDRRAVFIGRLPFRVHVTGRYRRLGCPRGTGAKASHGGVGTYLWAPLGSSPLGLGFWPLGGGIIYQTSPAVLFVLKNRN